MTCKSAVISTPTTCYQVVVDVLVIETVNAATFEGIVILLAGSHGFTLAERQVSREVQRQQP